METTKEKLVRLIESQGFADVQVYGAQGFYRTIKADCMRWEGHGLKGKLKVTFGSWDTMTECVRRGFKIVQENMPWAFEIVANETTNRQESAK